MTLQIPYDIYAVKLPEFLENIKTKKIVLIHGEGFGAWCWYKTIALLEETGLVPTALDLTGSGIDLTNTNNVTSLEAYSKPLIDYLENLPEDEKVRFGLSFKSFFLFMNSNNIYSGNIMHINSSR